MESHGSGTLGKERTRGQIWIQRSRMRRKKKQIKRIQSGKSLYPLSSPPHTHTHTGSSRATQTGRAASTSPTTAPNCGRAAWTTRSAAGTSERDASCSSTTLPRRSAHGHTHGHTHTHTKVDHSCQRSCNHPNDFLLLSHSIFTPLLPSIVPSRFPLLLPVCRSSLWATVPQASGWLWAWRAVT